jgi:hypothetical protein
VLIVSIIKFSVAWGAGIPAVRHIFRPGKIVLVDYSCRGQPRLETTAC